MSTKILSPGKANIKLIESELYHYHETLKELELLKLEVIEGHTYVEVSSKTGISKPTESKVMQMMSSLAIMETERRIRAIEYVIEMLKNGPEPRKYEFLEMKYFRHHYDDLAIQVELCIEQATFYRWRKEIIALVAQRLGYRV